MRIIEIRCCYVEASGRTESIASVLQRAKRRNEHNREYARDGNGMKRLERRGVRSSDTAHALHCQSQMMPIHRVSIAIAQLRCSASSSSATVARRGWSENGTERTASVRVHMHQYRWRTMFRRVLDLLDGSIE
jgi:hypothetical protein